MNLGKNQKIVKAAVEAGHTTIESIVANTTLNLDQLFNALKGLQKRNILTLDLTFDWNAEEKVKVQRAKKAKAVVAQVQETVSKVEELSEAQEATVEVGVVVLDTPVIEEPQESLVEPQEVIVPKVEVSITSIIEEALQDDRGYMVRKMSYVADLWNSEETKQTILKLIDQELLNNDSYQWLLNALAEGQFSTNALVGPVVDAAVKVCKAY